MDAKWNSGRSQSHKALYSDSSGHDRNPFPNDKRDQFLTRTETNFPVRLDVNTMNSSQTLGTACKYNHFKDF